MVSSLRTLKRSKTVTDKHNCWFSGNEWEWGMGEEGEGGMCGGVVLTSLPLVQCKWRGKFHYSPWIWINDENYFPGEFFTRNSDTLSAVFPALTPPWHDGKQANARVIIDTQSGVSPRRFQTLADHPSFCEMDWSYKSCRGVQQGASGYLVIPVLDQPLYLSSFSLSAWCRRLHTSSTQQHG